MDHHLGISLGIGQKHLSHLTVGIFNTLSDELTV